MLSWYGADKNKPAGEKTCSRAATKASRGCLPIFKPSWYKASTDKRWDTWAMAIPTRGSREPSFSRPSHARPAAMRWKSVSGRLAAQQDEHFQDLPRTTVAIKVGRPAPKAHSCSNR